MTETLAQSRDRCAKRMSFEGVFQPFPRSDGKWEAVAHSRSGGKLPAREALPATFETEESCQRVCDSRNRVPA